MAATMLLLASAAAPRIAAAGNALPQGPSLLSVVTALAVVIGLILLAAWLLRRLPGAGLRAMPGLRVVASLAIGPRERVVLVDVGGQQLLLGVTAQNVNLLHTLSEPLLDPPSAQGFADLLARLRHKDSA
jgi:flagellar protein FliO/FliZ